MVEEASGYKYEGGYWVWNPKRRVVVESRDVTFEDGLPLRTLHEMTIPPADDGELVVQSSPGVLTEPNPPAMENMSASLPPTPVVTQNLPLYPHRAR